jgi:CDP-diacylglycerol--glycerol-3-phosphate 3-phosphatidyltransferase
MKTTFTGAVGAICMYPLRAIINLCVRLRIHPNTLTLIGVIVNVAAAWALGFGRFMLAFVIMLVANIFDHRRRVTHLLKLQSAFGAFWDSALDRSPDLALLTGLIFLYFEAGPQRLRDSRGAGADLLDHDKLCAHIVAGPQMQVGFMER